MLLNIHEASVWATKEFQREITPANISYLIQYGRVKKIKKDGKTFLLADELKRYYEETIKKETIYKQKFHDINWHLSFDWVKEKERTKHVHRLHPYKGKFIPQLVEYFLDAHTDELKKEVFFRQGDTVLDPFCGSGTTLVVANELQMDAIGVDISSFNAFIANCKIAHYDTFALQIEANRLIDKLQKFSKTKKYRDFDKKLQELLSEFNATFFPSPEFKRLIREKKIDEKVYGAQKEEEFNQIYNRLLSTYRLRLQNGGEGFLRKWYMASIYEEMQFLFKEIKKIEDKNMRNFFTLVLSRTIRSCRATTHSDLASLKEPVLRPYYCKKHGKICKPLFTLQDWWQRYVKDSIERVAEFEHLRSDTEQICLVGDSRDIDIFKELQKKSTALFEKVKERKIDGIFTSPPYVGLINYHEQHEYAYELFGFKRNDEQEIGPLFKGKGIKARDEYVESIARVLRNAKKFLKQDANIFIVANDKFNLYPTIAKEAGLKIVKEFKRPVLNRVEKDKNPYAESIFWMR